MDSLGSFAQEIEGFNLLAIAVIDREVGNFRVGRAVPYAKAKYHV